jgi:CRISPR-associated protein Cas5d
MRSPPLHIRIRGSAALFTRPETKVERVSYEVITPSAARGVLEAVLFKPQMRWVIERITVLNPVRFFSVKRNEVASKVPATAASWSSANAGDDYFADDDRQQRNALILRDVDYVVTARVELTDKAEPPDDNPIKYVEMFKRRVENGQHFHQPYLGCREFPADVDLATGDEKPCDEVIALGEQQLGLILNDIQYASPRRAVFFEAVMREGVVEVPAMPSAPARAEDMPNAKQLKKGARP